jgi:hypothetical protein
MVAILIYMFDGFDGFDEFLVIFIFFDDHFIFLFFEEDSKNKNKCRKPVKPVNAGF